MRRIKYVVLFLLALLLLPMLLLAPNPGLLAQDCGDAENGEGCSSPGEYDVPSVFLPQISGPEEPNKAGPYDYSIIGGCPPYAWEVVPNESRSIMSIDQNGRLQLTPDSCGGYTIEVTDGCGNKATFGGMVAYNGQWDTVASCNSDQVFYNNYEASVIEGGYKYIVYRSAVQLLPSDYYISNCAHFCALAESYCSPGYGCSALKQGWRCRHY